MVWGENGFGTDFPYNILGNDTGECWRISSHPSGDDPVEDNRFIGRSQLWREDRYLFSDLELDRFLLLIKVIDAKENLSIQVHPDDVYVAEHENGSLEKTECWYIIDCSNDAQLVVGHNAKTREELKAMVQEESIGDFCFVGLLNYLGIGVIIQHISLKTKENKNWEIKIKK